MTLRRRKKPIRQDRIYLGKLLRPHALMGELKFQSFGADPWILEEFRQVHLEHRNEELYLEVEYIRGSLNSPIVKFVGVDDRDGSEGLTGAILWVEEVKLPALEENEFYESDFLYARVINEAGEELGRVEQIMETGASDVLVIRDALGNERLLPAIIDVVREVRREENTIVVRPLEEDF